MGVVYDVHSTEDVDVLITVLVMKTGSNAFIGLDW